MLKILSSFSIPKAWTPVNKIANKRPREIVNGFGNSFSAKKQMGGSFRGGRERGAPVKKWN